MLTGSAPARAHPETSRPTKGAKVQAERSRKGAQAQNETLTQAAGWSHTQASRRHEAEGKTSAPAAHTAPRWLASTANAARRFRLWSAYALQR